MTTKTKPADTADVPATAASQAPAVPAAAPPALPAAPATGTPVAGGRYEVHPDGTRTRVRAPAS